MNFYQSLEFLVLGSRLRRMSETFLSAVNEIYKKHDIEFEASWFPVFYLLYINKQVSIRFISDTLSVSHSAASQLTTSLQQKGLIKMTVAQDDARKKLISFTEKGAELLQQVQPVWQALQEAMTNLTEEGDARFLLNALTAIENNLDQEDLLTRIEKRLK